MIQAGYIPSPREIMNRNPDNSLKDPVTGVSIGFHCDPAYVKMWRSKQQCIRGTIPDDQFSQKYILDMLRLFRYFVNFYKRTFVNRTSLLILNTRDGLLASNCTALNVIFPCGDPSVNRSWLNNVTTKTLWI